MPETSGTSSLASSSDAAQVSERPLRRSSRSSRDLSPPHESLRRRSSKGKQAAVEPLPRSSSPTWVDIETGASHSRKPRSDEGKSHAGPRPVASAKSRKAPAVDLHDFEGTSTGFRPRLGQIVEGKENDSGRQSPRLRNTVRGRSGPLSSSRRSRAVDQPGGVSRRSVKHKQELQGRIGELLNPSLVSLLSGVTNTSSASSGSNSTITQKSYDHASSESGQYSRDRPSEPKVTRSKAKKSSRQRMESSNVFDFMDQRPLSGGAELPRTRRGSKPSVGQPTSDGRALHASQPSPYVQPFDPSLIANAPIPDDMWTQRDRVSSDSGISLQGSSPSQKEQDHGHAVPRHAHDGPDTDHLLALQRTQGLFPEGDPACPAPDEDELLRQRIHQQEEDLRDHVLRSPQPRRKLRFDYDSREMDGQEPHLGAGAPYGFQPVGNQFAHYAGPPVPTHASTFLVPQAPPTVPAKSPVASDEPVASPSDLCKMTRSGYELLAAELSTCRQEKNSPAHDVPVPMYRKFDTLNHRVLLHLQDEIAELEEELRMVDEYIAQMSNAGGKVQRRPGSRRLDARFGGDMHYRRTELLGIIYMKLGQYNQALSSYGSLLKTFDSAKPGDLHGYRAWMEKHAPIDPVEARFLDQEKDLISVKHVATPAAASSSNDGTAPTFALGIPLLILPLMAPMVIPGLPGRLFTIVIIGLAEAALVSSTGVTVLMSKREWSFYSVVYLSVMIVIAGVVP